MMHRGGSKMAEGRPVADAAWRRDGMGRAGVLLIVCLFTLPFMALLFGGRAGALAVWQNAAKLTAMGGGTSKLSCLICIYP